MKKRTGQIIQHLSFFCCPSSRISDSTSAAAAETASANGTADGAAWTSAREASPSATPSAHPAAAGADEAPLGKGAADTALAAGDTGPVLRFRREYAGSPGPVAGFRDRDAAIHPGRCGKGAALRGGGTVRAIDRLPAESALFNDLPWCR